MNWSLADFEFGATILGKGLFGTVYHGRFKRKRSNSQEQNVAIKVMDRISMMKRQEYIDMVMNERRNLTSLGSSRHVVKLYLSFVDTHNLIMVMELCSCDLAALVKCGNSDTHNRTHDPLYLDFASVQVLTAQLVMALEEIHSQSLIHCDLKPENVLLTNSGLLKLTDFATARFITSFNSIDTEKNHAVNPSTHFMGTADYLPPEILLGGSNQNPDVAQDLWLWAESGRTSALTLNVIAFSLVVSLMTMTNATSIEVTLLSVLYNTVEISHSRQHNLVLISNY